jgi:hypothetical protein
VWCETGMYPRKLFDGMDGGAASFRCVCMNDIGWSDLLQVSASNTSIGASFPAGPNARYSQLSSLAGPLAGPGNGCFIDCSCPAANALQVYPDCDPDSSTCQTAPPLEES